MKKPKRVKGPDVVWIASYNGTKFAFSSEHKMNDRPDKWIAFGAYVPKEKEPKR